MSLCKETDLSQVELAKLLKPLYPRMSTNAVSVAETPDKSGVRFTAAAKKAAYNLTGRVERKPKRVHDHHLTVWVDDRQLRFLAKQPMSKGEVIRDLIDQAIKNAATGGSNTDDRKK